MHLHELKVQVAKFRSGLSPKNDDASLPLFEALLAALEDQDLIIKSHEERIKDLENKTV